MAISFLNEYIILLEIFIAFSVFGIFFAIFMNYFFIKFQTNIFTIFIKDSINIYKKYLFENVNLDKITKFLNETDYIKTIEKDSIIKEHEVDTYNKQYDNLLFKIIGVMILFIASLVLIPIVLGIISINDINFTYISLSFILHMGFIILFEGLFVYLVLANSSPIKIFNVIKQFL
jgi:hypothetical protein